MVSQLVISTHRGDGRNFSPRSRPSLPSGSASHWHTRRRLHKHAGRVIVVDRTGCQTQSDGGVLPAPRLGGLGGRGAYQSPAGRATGCGRGAEKDSGGGTEHDGGERGLEGMKKKSGREQGRGRHGDGRNGGLAGGTAQTGIARRREESRGRGCLRPGAVGVTGAGQSACMIIVRPQV